LIILSTFDHKHNNAPAFYALILFMEMALVGVFVAMDGFLFYVFWELALIPIYFICLLWGGKDRVQITFKFFLYTLVGSLFMLVGFIYLYLHTPNRSFNINDLYAAGASLNPVEQAWVFWGIFIAFAIKMPIFPFHTWQPATYAESPNAGTMLLSGIMLKMGLYGVIRWLIPVVPAGVAASLDFVMILCIISIVYGSCIAIVQKDFRKLIAYSSIAHVGLIAAGIFTWNSQGLQGAVIQMISHGINVVGLFFIADIITRRTNTRIMSDLGGIRSVAPSFATLFMIVMLGTVALPLTNGFIGEFLLLNGVYQYDAYAGAFGGLTIILGAVYMLRSYQTVMLGETKSLTKTFGDLTFNEKAVLVPIAILIILIGVYPKPILDISAPAVEKLVSIYKIAH
jgi:NADH-quinone oxidoreductase subunit M